MGYFPFLTFSTPSCTLHVEICLMLYFEIRPLAQAQNLRLEARELPSVSEGSPTGVFCVALTPNRTFDLNAPLVCQERRNV